MRQSIALFGGAFLVGACALAWASTGRAQEVTYLRRAVPAPTNALELKVGTGYTQGFGRVGPRRAIPDVAGAGVGFGLDADYRVDPRWSLGLQGEYQELQGAMNMGARGFAANVGVTYHGSPLLRGDPWVRLGGGYRLLWDVSPPGAPTTVRHGLELAKVTVGYDVRITDAVAIAPELGADLNVFLWQSQNGINNALSSAQVGSFVFAGIQGRFDVAGQSSTTTTVARDLTMP
jgi:hypothetical protein